MFWESVICHCIYTNALRCLCVSAVFSRHPVSSCPSVRPSITLLYCVQTAKDNVLEQFTRVCQQGYTKTTQSIFTNSVDGWHLGHGRILVIIRIRSGYEHTVHGKMSVTRLLFNNIATISGLGAGMRCFTESHFSYYASVPIGWRHYAMLLSDVCLSDVCRVHRA